MVNSPLIWPYLLGGVALGGYLKFPWFESLSCHVMPKKTIKPSNKNITNFPRFHSFHINCQNSWTQIAKTTFTLKKKITQKKQPWIFCCYETPTNLGGVTRSWVVSHVSFQDLVEFQLWRVTHSMVVARESPTLEAQVLEAVGHQQKMDDFTDDGSMGVVGWWV